MSAAYVGDQGRWWVATREQVLALVDQGLDYPEIARRLGVPAGQAYLIATGMPADGGDTYTDAERQRTGVLPTAQHLLGARAENPTTKPSVLEWTKARVGRDVQMQAAARERDPEPAEPQETGTDEDSDALVVLTRDHNQVKALQKQLQTLPSHATGGSPEHLARRKSIVDMITVRLSQHEAAEEQYLWPTVRQVLPDGDRQAEQGIGQEQQGKETLAALGELQPDTAEFDEQVERLVLLLRTHVAYEEKLFLELRAAMPDEDRRQLGRRLLAAKKAPSDEARDAAAERRGKAAQQREEPKHRKRN